MDITKITPPRRYARKTGINLARREVNKKSIAIIAGITLAVLAAFAAFMKFGIIDQYERLRAAQEQYDDLYRQNSELAEKITDYSRVQLEYRTYSTEWMDKSYVGRQDILDLIEAELLPCGDISSITITENTALITISGMTLEGVSEMVVSIKEQPIVADVTVNTAQTESEEGKDVTCTLTIKLLPPVEEVG